jgi:hypothetical protein
VEEAKMNKKSNSKTLILAVAAVLLAGSVAWAGSELRLETRLKGSRAVAGTMAGKAKFSNRLDRARRKFSVEIEDGRSGHMFDVLISGVVVGTVLVNDLGVGELDYDDTADRNDSDQRFPRNFPELDGGEVVQVGPLTGTLQLK